MRPARTVVPAAVAAGLVVALAVTLLQPSVYRASGTIVLVEPGKAPQDTPSLARAARVARELLRSRSVAESALRSLSLGESADDLLGRVEVESEAGSSVLRLTVEDSEPDRARRLAQQLAEVFTTLYSDRFGQQARAVIWDAPRADPDRVSPRPALNLGVGATLGLVAGLALVLLRGRRLLPEQPLPAPEDAGAPAPAAVERPPPVVVQPAAVPVSAPPPPAGPFRPPRAGEWKVADVERLLAEHGDAFPDRREELALYLDSFRGVAAPDGTLPPGVESIVLEEFGGLIARARAVSL